MHIETEETPFNTIVTVITSRDELLCIGVMIVVILALVAGF